MKTPTLTCGGVSIGQVPENIVNPFIMHATDFLLLAFRRSCFIFDYLVFEHFLFFTLTLCYAVIVDSVTTRVSRSCSESGQWISWTAG